MKMKILMTVVVPTGTDCLQTLLIQLQSAMEGDGCWESESPSSEALSSVEPFAVDTLQFTQWLQWLFIPRLLWMLEQGVELPRGSAVAAMAEVCGLFSEQNRTNVVSILKSIDALLNE